MPKKAIILNGFGGGINKNADLSDLAAEGRGKDEVVTCDNLFLDKRGRIVAEYPTVVSGNPSGGVTLIDADSSETTPNSLIIADNKAYMGPGVYSVQGAINWSANEDFIAHTPAVGNINDTDPDAHNSGIDLDVQSDTSGDLILFQGYNATHNPLGVGVLFNHTGAEQSIHDSDLNGIEEPQHWLGYALDTDTDGKWAEDSDFWYDTAGDDKIKKIGTGTGDVGDVTFENAAGGYIDMDITADTSIDADNMDTMLQIDFWHTVSNNDAWSLIFRGGRTKRDDDSDTRDGYFGKFFPNLDNRDLRLELYAPSLTDNIDYLVIHYDCGGTGDMEFDYLKGGVAAEHDPNGKIWKLSHGDLVGNGATAGWVIIDIPWSSAFYTGSQFHPAKVKMIGLGLSTDADSWSDSDPVMKVKDFSIKESTTAAWDNSTYAFHQTSINKNGIESIPMKYGYAGGASAIEGTQYPFLFTLYKPTSQWSESDNSDHGWSGGGGRVYYQEVDNKENPRGDKLLLADWDYDKGVKMAGQDTFTEWNDTFVDRVGETQPAYQMALDNPPVMSTYALESGYPREVETVNALFKTSAVVGRTVYVGNVAKQTSGIVFTGIDHDADSDSGSNPQYGIEADGDSNADFVKIGNYNHSIGDAFVDLEATHGFDGGDYVLMTGFTNAANNGLFKIDSDEGTDGFADDGDGDDGALTNNKMYLNAFDGTANAGLVNENVTANIIGLYGFREFEPSLILKGAVGKKGGFPDNQFIDLELGSDSIQVMENVGDRLFVFTENRLIVLNVAQDVEFMEADLLGYGAKIPRQITKIGEGLALINSTGVHFFNGEKFVDLTLGKLDHAVIDPDNCAIMYDPNRKLLYCYFDAATGSTANGIYYYSFITESWVGNNHAVVDGTGVALGGPGSNSYIGEDGKAWHEDGGALYYIGTSTTSGTANRTIVLETGRIDCGNIVRNKRFYKVHISVKNATTDQKVYWRTDEDADGDYDSGTALTTTDGLHTISMSGAKGKWIQVKVASTGANAKSSFEIGDMSISFREKTLK